MRVCYASDGAAMALSDWAELVHLSGLGCMQGSQCMGGDWDP